MALDEKETMPRRTINTVKWDDIGVVMCGVMARAVAGLPVEEETPPFSSFHRQAAQEEKTGAPLLF